MANETVSKAKDKASTAFFKTLGRGALKVGKFAFGPAGVVADFLLSPREAEPRKPKDTVPVALTLSWLTVFILTLY